MSAQTVCDGCGKTESYYGWWKRVWFRKPWVRMVDEPNMGIQDRDYCHDCWVAMLKGPPGSTRTGGEP